MCNRRDSGDGLADTIIAGLAINPPIANAPATAETAGPAALADDADEADEAGDADADNDGELGAEPPADGDGVGVEDAADAVTDDSMVGAAAASAEGAAENDDLDGAPADGAEAVTETVTPSERATAPADG
jgi:hypothetical protein